MIRRGQARRLARVARRCDLDERMRHLADALLHLRAAVLPASTAEPVEDGLRIFRTVARQELEILDRQIELVTTGIVDLEAVVRHAGRRDGLKPDKAPDAVIHMDDEIAGSQGRDFGQEILRALLLVALTDEAVSEQVLFADDGKVRSHEACLEPDHRERGRAAVEAHGLRK